MRRDPALIGAVCRLIDGVDGKRRTVGKQGRLSGAVQCRECLPEVRLALRQPLLPALMSRLDGLCRHAFPQSQGLGWKGRRAKPDLETVSRRCEPVKGRQHEVVQHRLERDRRIVGKRITERERPMRGQFDDEAVR